MSYANQHLAHRLRYYRGLGQTKDAADHTAQDWQTATTVGSGLVTGVAQIIGAATGHPPTPTDTQILTQPSTVPLTTAPPVSAAQDWYWPVIIGVGVAVIGGIAYMGYNVKKPVTANRMRRNRRTRRNPRRRSSKGTSKSTGWRRHPYPPASRRVADDLARVIDGASGGSIEVKVVPVPSRRRPGRVAYQVYMREPRRRVKKNSRLSKSQRRRLSKHMFVFPATRGWPIESAAAARDAISHLRMGHVKNAGEFLQVRNFIQRHYPDVWRKYAGHLSWTRSKTTKGRAMATRARRRTSRKAA